MSKQKKFLVSLLSITLLFTSFPTPIFAYEVKPTNKQLEVLNNKLGDIQTTTQPGIGLDLDKYVGDSYEIEFRVNSKGESLFNGELKVINTSDKPLKDWKLKFDFGHQIKSMWNGKIAIHEGNSYVINNEDWNKDIAPGASVNIGFEAVWNEEIKVPKNYDLLVTKEDARNEAYAIDFKVISDWGQAFNGEISITNNTKKIIENWALEFDFDRNIESFWDAKIEDHKDNHYIITNKEYNAAIAPGQTIRLGFEGNPGNVTSPPTGYKLWDAALLDKETEEMTEDLELDTDADGIVDWLEKYYGTAIDTIDTDGDGLSDYIEVYVLHTDPLVTDTNGDNINDGEEDLDLDGLTNLGEYGLGTNPVKADTDGDGLKDGEEVRDYGTSPVLEDTDGDDLGDGEEVILGLDPLNKYSDGYTLDSERLTSQILSQNKIEESLLDGDNLLIPSLSGEVTGSIDKNVSITNTSLEALKNNHAVVGEPIEILTNYDDESTLNLEFSYSKLLDDYSASEIKNLIICGFEEDDFVPYDTVISEEDNTLSAKLTKEGTYFVLKVDEFLGNLGIDTYSSDIDMSIDAQSDEQVEGQADVNDGTWVLLSDYQYVKLDNQVFLRNMGDIDQDGVSDYKELGTLTEKDLTPFIKVLLENKGISEDDYTGKTTVSTYNALSSPVLADTDFDGITDDKDPAPKDGNAKGILVNTSTDISSSIGYRMDYRTFFGNNSSYNNALSITSSVYASVIYDGISYKDSATGKSYGIKELMEYQGFSDVIVYDLSSAYSDSHLSEVAIGHRKVVYNGTTKEIVGIIVRGTNGTIEEWSSNFDIGSTNKPGSASDWTIRANHKGFDIAATRVLKYVENYMASKVDKSVGNALWITGHSRGAGIANILGARLEDKGYDTFTYTYAAPNTTTSSKASSYDSIFNILNSDDFVPYLPMTKWNFKKYGKTALISVAANYEKEWESLTGKGDYNPDTYGMQATIDALAATAIDREDCYRYTCTHGDKTNNNITITNYGTSEKSREEAIAKIPSNALPYCIITRYKGFLFAGWDFDVCQTPAYFMQLLAAQMSGEISTYRFVTELNIADRYEKAKRNIISSAIGGLEHPHYQETYYVLANHVSTSSFK